MKKIFGILGAIGFFLLIYYSGWKQVWSDFLKVGWAIIPLCLTFIPTLFLYALGWYLVTPRFQKRGFFGDICFFIVGSLLGVAWNNLTPFAKVGGEVVRALYLSQRIAKPQAISSVLTYNLTHLVGAFFSFVVAAVIILVFWEPPQESRMWIAVGGGVSLLACVVSVGLPLSLGILQKRFRKRRSSNGLGNRLGFLFAKFKKSSSGVLFLYAIRQNHQFFLKYGFRWVAAVTLEVFARFIEGLTFYYAFLLLGAEVPLVKAFVYDVARTFSDTLFFFVPYSLGSREIFLNILMQEVYLLPVALAVSSSLIYRLVEVVWTAVGYFVWMKIMSRGRLKKAQQQTKP